MCPWADEPMEAPRSGRPRRSDRTLDAREEPAEKLMPPKAEMTDRPRAPDAKSDAPCRLQPSGVLRIPDARLAPALTR